MNSPRLSRYLDTFPTRQFTASYSNLAPPVMPLAHRKPGHARPEKRPPLTHFLCLPLVNSTSMPQLESSLLAFKAAHPTPSQTDAAHGLGQPGAHGPKPLIPEGAIRPLGTLHLTLGVMSLPSKERFDEAVAFFQSLDLAALLHEAERVATEQRQKVRATHSSSEAGEVPAEPISQEHTSETGGSLQPLTISLESLRALPRGKAATVLHASPVDSTGRLYPFCLMLRDKFLEAGFLVGEADRKTDAENKHEAASSLPQLTPDPISAPSRIDPYTAALTRKPKPRPLLLHTTLVNTIYVRGRGKPEHGAKGAFKKPKGPKRIEFDARDLIARYQDYYLDGTRKTPRLGVVTSQLEGTEMSAATTLEDGAAEPSSKATSSSRPGPRFPYVWAENIPIDSVCICEMGAKNLAVDGDGLHPETLDLHARLGAAYTIVTQRDLNPRGQGLHGVA
ncbi:hypothetical protein N7492_007978 [Penicillium capsulatum]|uniref:A-kinase anchor protein 7-like phosphoesterase domain-containing protein n=1 Tax=Penicillium capsulatum TaxID=69766 RepID=A0A9W9HS50_9EURO|nr:hypothetical protein N7492_007978 [Penicillium capsulatum]KAJ6105385.1 hypothetical protein N7512_008902 [Penicillium capsulatum]